MRIWEQHQPTNQPKKKKKQKVEIGHKTFESCAESRAHLGGGSKFQDHLTLTIQFILFASCRFGKVSLPARGKVLAADKVAICVSLWVLFDLSALCFSIALPPCGTRTRSYLMRERERESCAQCRTLCLTSQWFLRGMFELVTRSVYGMNTLERCCRSCFNNRHPGRNLQV